MDPKEILAAAEEGGGGTVWTLAGSEDLNANLVRFPVGRGVGEHVNEEVDVIMVGMAGCGEVTVGEEEHGLRAGRVVFVPKGLRRSVQSYSDDFAYLSVHRRRGPIKLSETKEPRQRSHDR